MNANQIIEIMGGRAELIRFTGLTKGRISQWATDGDIPRPWLMLFHEKHPDKIPHPDAITKGKPQEASHA